MFDTKKFGAYAARKRKNADMTQSELAEILSLTRQAISKYETGDSFPDVSILIKMAEVFGITLDELITSGNPTQGETKILKNVTEGDDGLVNIHDLINIELFCAIPFPEHSDRFTTGQKKRYENILSKCTHKEVINRHHSPVAYKRLNYYMIDRSQYLLAVYDQDKSERSGLGQAVNYAVKKNLTITFIHPDTAQSSNYIP